ncbi:GIY-YIG nuclease family protein [Chroococcidiopsidales cyanobacterium LEGE 13417]|nr:GIY-YIG nuclease family protein [Chroococcidiopsidales cyanobacterium LEGE 13417]
MQNVETNQLRLIEDSIDLHIDRLPYVEFLKKERLPESAGIYFVIDGERKIWYVGKAQNLKARWKGHHRADQLQKIHKKNPLKIFWHSCDRGETILAQLETFFIEKYYPVLNQTKVEIKRITPAEIELRNVLAKISKYVILIGYEEYSREFELPTVFLKYDWTYRNPARTLRSIFDAVNKKGNLRWSYYWRVKTTPIWKTKCNGVAIVVCSDAGTNKFIQQGEEVTLAGVKLINISANDFQKYRTETDWSQSYHPAIQRYTKDPIPLLWSKDLEVNQPDVEALKELNQRRTASREYRPRGRRVKVVCNAIGWNVECVIQAYQEAIDWFGGYEALGLRQAYSYSFSIKGWRAPRVSVRIPEVNDGITTYRSISAPISASTKEELLQRFEKIKQLSSLHQKAKIEI